MASRQFIQRSTSTARSFLNCTRKTLPPSNLNGIPTSTPRLAGRRNPILSSRLPVELGCAQSLMPLHSATASSLLKSMLSSKVGQWGSLSEGMDNYQFELGCLVMMSSDARTLLFTPSYRVWHSYFSLIDNCPAG